MGLADFATHVPERFFVWAQTVCAESNTVKTNRRKEFLT
jgi:hypothetical protein